MATVAEGQELQQRLYATQNRDGGWGFHQGSSWTEPTALALLALSAQPEPAEQQAVSQGYAWLLRSQRPDGGWAPQPGVHITTWVTSLATLALLQANQTASLPRALKWLQGEVRASDSPIQRLIMRMENGSSPPAIGAGASWFPGTAAWLYPTAMTVLAFLRAGSLMQEKALQVFAQRGQEYILSRRCRDGGWNHGGSRYLSEDAFSYPEMTGVALLALENVAAGELRYPLKRAETFLRSPNSSEGLSWLQMAMAKHNGPVFQSEVNLPCRTTRDLALRSLALSASSPRNILVCSHL